MLCEATGGLLSKHTYTAKTMTTHANDYVSKCCEEAQAEAVKEFAKRFENELTKIEEFYIDEEHENFISANKVIALLDNLAKERVGES